MTYGRLTVRRTILAFSILTLASLVTRIAFFGNYTLEGTDCDGAAYMNLAGNIASGAGWVTNSLRFLFLLPPVLPQPDAHWSPLYPLLTSLSYTLFGSSFTSAKLVPLVLGALVPGVIFLLTAKLARSWLAGLIAGVLAVFHATLVTWSLRIETEIASTLFVALAFVVLLSGRPATRPYWLGIVMGLAYLTKYQSILLWAPVILYYVLNVPARTAVRQVAIAGAVFVVAISPWLVRNTLTFGDPFYTDLRYNMISYYPEFGGEPRYLSSLTMPPSTFGYMSSHVATVLGYAKWGLRVLVTGFLRENQGSVLLIPFVLLGLFAAARAWRIWAPVLLFALVLAAVTSISIPQVRYLHVLIPFWIALAGAGCAWLLGVMKKRGTLGAVGRALVWLVLAGAVVDEARSAAHVARNANSEWTPSANFCALEAQAASGFIRDHATPSEPVFAPETFHYALILNRNVIQVPYSEDDLLLLSERYGARYVVITDRDLQKRLPSWAEEPPTWAHLVLRLPAGRIPRPDANRDYRHVSDLRIYELTAK